MRISAQIRPRWRCLCMCWVGRHWSFTVHGPEEFDKPQFIGLGEKIRRCAFVVAISSYARSQLYRWVEQRDGPKCRLCIAGWRPHILPEPRTAVRSAAPCLRGSVMRAKRPTASGRSRASACGSRRRISSWCWRATARCAAPSRHSLCVTICRTLCGSQVGSVAGRCMKKFWPRGRSCCRASPRAFRWSSWKQWR